MNSPFLIFIGLVFSVALVLFIFLRGAVAGAAMHAKQYSLTYVKGGALITLAMLANFKETFHSLTIERATAQAWWDWAILFMGPIAAGLAVLVAFLDRSVQQAQQGRDAAAKNESLSK